MTRTSQVLHALTEGPSTAGEIGAELGLPGNTVSAFLCHLMRRGLVTRKVYVEGWQSAFLWEVVDLPE